MRRPRSGATVVGIVVAAGLIIVCVIALAWRVTGGRWFVVQTPSMGQAAPVGTLLLTRPTTIGAVHVGDIISFHVPGSSEIYSHRVVAKTATTIRTKGDINPAKDAWVLHQQDLIGKVSTRWWAVGWILRGLPLLLLCLAAVWLLAAFLRWTWRSPVRLVGTALSFSVVGLYLHPWVGIQRLDQASVTGGTKIRLVSDGILPINADAVHGNSTVLRNGQVGSVLVDKSTKGRLNVDASPHLSFWWIVAVVIVCLLPLLWTLIVGLTPLPTPGRHEAPEHDADEDHEAGDPPDEGEDNQVGLDIVRHAQSAP